ncbi:MAG: hypothetical protein CML42_08235 [Rhodobacteraceae bacterium]|nr:hypothetical protein [Paracoccaceae bacterium]|tara:strand:+ start:57309 stop:57767 length:459 start_codon:yes stop_codon:yes gene_type:complete
MSAIQKSITSINAEIEEYEKKLKELKQLRITGYSFMRCFKITSKDHVNKLKGLTVNAEYEYNDHCHDEFGHDEEAYLKVTFGKNECLEIHYQEAQGAGTESRYMPTIECEINVTEKAKKLLFKNIDIDMNDYQHDEAYKEFRDIIRNIVTNK